MGVTYLAGTVVGPSGEEALDVLVDGGSQYTLLPEDAWRRIGLQPQRRQRFRLADGTLLGREISNCVVKLAELGETPTPVVVGEPGDVALLGAVTLKELGLVLNPFTRTLHPAAPLMV